MKVYDCKKQIDNEVISLKGVNIEDNSRDSSFVLIKNA